MSHYGQRWTVLLSSTSGNQSAVRTGGSQVNQSAVGWRSAVGSRQSVSSQRRGQRRRRRRQRTTTAELPAHCRTCGAGTILSGRRSRLHFAGHAALPPATEATTATDTEAEVEATDTESGLQRSFLRGCWVLRRSGAGNGRSSRLSSPPPPPSHTSIKMTKAVANDDGGGADGGSSF